MTAVARTCWSQAPDQTGIEQWCLAFGIAQHDKFCECLHARRGVVAGSAMIALFLSGVERVLPDSMDVFAPALETNALAAELLTCGVVQQRESWELRPTDNGSALSDVSQEYYCLCLGGQRRIRIFSCNLEHGRDVLPYFDVISTGYFDGREVQVPDASVLADMICWRIRVNCDNARRTRGRCDGALTARLHRYAARGFDVMNGL
jgi:hypothetical protein